MAEVRDPARFRGEATGGSGVSLNQRRVRRPPDVLSFGHGFEGGDALMALYLHSFEEVRNCGMVSAAVVALVMNSIRRNLGYHGSGCKLLCKVHKALHSESEKSSPHVPQCWACVNSAEQCIVLVAQLFGKPTIQHCKWLCFLLMYQRRSPWCWQGHGVT